MASSDIWFPFYIGDYLADTMHLDRSEHGAYLLLLFSYYKNRGPLPDNDHHLAKIVKATLSDWSAIRSIIAPFFKIQNGKWFHTRAEKEIQRAISVQDARRKGAAITNAKLGRSHCDTVIDTPSDSGATRSMVGIPQSQPQSHSEPELQPKPESEPVPILSIKDKSRDVLRHLNAKSGVRYREVESNLILISARLAEPEVTVDGVKQMIDRQVAKWKGTEQEQYLRPETLFRRSKFDGYYASRAMPVPPREAIANHEEGF